MISDNEKSRIKSRFIFRIVIPAAIILLYFMFTNLASGWMPFFANIMHPAIDIDQMEMTDMYKGRAVHGELVDVIDCLASSVTTTTNQSGKMTNKYTDSYYWIVLIDTNTLMIVQAPESNYSTMEYNADLFWKSLEPETDSDKSSMAHSGSMGYYDENGRWVETHKDGNPYKISVDGVLVSNDKEIVQFYEKWLRDTGFKEAGLELTLAPYTLDMTKSYDSRIKNFWTGMLLLLLTLGIVAISVITVIKKKQKEEEQTVLAANDVARKRNSYSTYGDIYRSPSGISGGGNATGSFQSQRKSSSYGTADSTSQLQGSYTSYGSSGGTSQSQNGGLGYSNFDSTYKPQNSASGSGYTDYGFSDDLYTANGDSDNGTSGANYR